MIATALRKSSPEQTLESLYKRHASDVYRYARALVPRQSDAEDATQTTFMNAYQALERGERPRDAGKWLRAIALNVCREHHRRAGRRPAEVPLEDDPAELVLDPPTPAIRDIVHGLSALPFNQRAAIVMREFEGRSVAEIGTALDLSPSAVEALLFRARRALREQLDDQLTCGEAEEAISRQLDKALPRRERGPLRAHLRSCSECAALARRLRAQRKAVRSLALLPIPAALKLSRFFKGSVASASAAGAGGTAASSGGSLIAGLVGSAAAKVAIVTVVGAAAVGVGYESLHRTQSPSARIPSHLHLGAGTAARTSASAARAATHGGVNQTTGRSAAAASRRAKTAGTAGHARQAGRSFRGAVGSSPATTPGRGHSHSAAAQQVGPPGAASQPHGSANSASPGQSGAAHGSGHAYGHAKPGHATPPGHAYGHTKTANPHTAMTPAAAPVTVPPGQAKQPSTAATGKGKLKHQP
ncbi:MAG TPA: sigma-70 family RNA polymerase sigma factor [Solirubrobacteraceae bacterium]|jgi:RNA polymerase sigma factor (sigma-70 family)